MSSLASHQHARHIRRSRSPHNAIFVTFVLFVERCCGEVGWRWSHACCKYPLRAGGDANVALRTEAHNHEPCCCGVNTTPSRLRSRADRRMAASNAIAYAPIELSKRRVSFAGETADPVGVVRKRKEFPDVIRRSWGTCRCLAKIALEHPQRPVCRSCADHRRCHGARLGRPVRSSGELPDSSLAILHRGGEEGEPGPSPVGRYRSVFDAAASCCSRRPPVSAPRPGVYSFVRKKLRYEREGVGPRWSW